MNTPDEEAVRAADDAVLAMAEGVIGAGMPPHWGLPLKSVVMVARRALAISRRLQGENRELRETLERVLAVAPCRFKAVTAECGLLKNDPRHVIGAADGWHRCQAPRAIEAAIADAGRGT